MKILNRILAVVLIASLLCIASAALIGCTPNEPQQEKKAIIFLHALLIGGLYDEDTGEPVWDPFDNEEISYMSIVSGDIVTLAGDMIFNDNGFKQQLEYLTSDDPAKTSQTLLAKIRLNEDGTPVNPNVKPVPFDDFEGRQRYGAINGYRDLAEGLEERYGEDYDVKMFNYDWRRDPRLAASELETYINAQGYTDVILVSHSLGSIVAAQYLAKAENREKINLFMPVGGPFLGSLNAITAEENPWCFYDSIRNLLGSIPLLGGVLDMIETIYGEQFLPIIKNTETVFYLMPAFELINTPYYGEGESFIYVDGDPITDKDELYDFYESRPWAKMSNGELKPAVANMRAFYEQMLPNGSCTTNLVNTYYVISQGKGLQKKVFYVTDAATGEVTVDWERTESEGLSLTEGDGIVPGYSATANNSLNGDNVYTLNAIEHNEMAINYENIREILNQKIDETWNLTK